MKYTLPIFALLVVTMSGCGKSPEQEMNDFRIKKYNECLERATKKPVDRTKSMEECTI